MATRNVFVYGITADPDVMFLITRIPADTEPALLEDHDLARSQNGSPTIRPSKGQRIRGLLIRDVTDSYVARLDGYFGPNYERKEVFVKSRGSTARAEAYVLGPHIIIPEGSVDLDGVQGDGDC